jgi:RNA polymerase sigma-70 factor (ECF subfamily)
LLQETYYRFLRAAKDYESEAHRRNSLFHIATNLVRDIKRRPAPLPLLDPESAARLPADLNADDAVVVRTDLQRAMNRLKPRERMLLWLAYAQGESHREIAQALGLKPGSIKLLLFRARRKLATFLAGGRS